MSRYEDGDWVTIRCQVISSWKIGNVPRVCLAPDGSAGQLNLDEAKILERVEPPVPPLPDEPEHHMILRGSNGQLWTHVDATRYSGPGWKLVNSSTTFYWSRGFYESHGPFDVFAPGAKI